MSTAYADFVRLAGNDSNSLGGKFPPIDRGRLAEYFLLNGEPQMALNAVVDPYSVPFEAILQSHKDDIEAAQRAADATFRDKLWNVIRRTIKNPFALAGIVLTVGFPVAGRKEVAKWFETSFRYDRFPSVIERFVSGGEELLRDAMGRPTRMRRILFEGIMEMGAREAESAQIMVNAIEKAKSLLGRDLTRRELFEVVVEAEKWWHPKSPVWNKVRKLTGRNFKILRPQLNEGQKIVLDAWDQVRRKYYKEVIEESHYGGLKILNQRLVANGMIEGIPPKEKVDFFFPHFVKENSTVHRDKIIFFLEHGNPEAAARMLFRFKTGIEQERAAYERFVLGEKIPGSLKKRQFSLLPSVDEMKEIRHLVGDDAIQAVKELVSGEIRAAGKEGENVVFGEYTLSLPQVYRRYVKGMERFRAWVMRPRLRALREEVLNFAKSGNHDLAILAKDVFIPMAQGMLTYEQYNKLLRLSAKRIKWLKVLSENPVFRSEPVKPLANWLRKRILDSSSVLSTAGPENFLTSYLYINTLGFNIKSALSNLMQTFNTTLPTLGVKNTLEGITRALERSAKYYKLRLRGISHDTAVQRVFPEFFKSGLERSPALAHEIFAHLDRTWSTTANSGLPRKAWDKFAQVAMFPFRAVEQFNWWVAFEGAMAAIEREAPTLLRKKPQEAIQAATDIVLRTQFLAGPLSRPVGTANLPPLLRMLTQFPLRFTGFLLGAAKRGEYGVLGNALVAGPLIRNAFQEFAGVDVEEATVLGALPVPRGLSPFYPFPIVPPIVSIAGAATSDILEGRFDKTRYTLPLLAPAGLAASRVASLASERTAQLLGRKYADFQHPNPDGTINLYTAKGQLVGAFQPWEVTAMALGFKPKSVLERTEAVRILLGQRDLARQIRDQVRQGIARNDMSMVAKGVEQWKRYFPDASLILKPSDYQAILNRRTRTQAEAVLKTLPADVRPMFQEALGFEATTGLLEETLPGIQDLQQAGKLGLDFGGLQ